LFLVNSKIHAIVDEDRSPWGLMLTPRNTAACVMAQECVSLIPGIKQLLADKGYDTDASYIKTPGSDRRYDDGGLSGASLDRPALQKLLADVGAGKKAWTFHPMAGGCSSGS
jgi:hypothetical protein